jgi:hypothetical protein
MCEQLIFLNPACVFASNGQTVQSPPSPPPAPVLVSVSPTSLSFAAASVSTPRPATQFFTGTVTGTIKGNLYLTMSMALSGTVVSVPVVTMHGTNTGQAQVIPALPSALGPGSHTEVIWVYACPTDINCAAGQLAGSPRAVEVTYTINGLRAEPAALQFTISDASTSANLTQQVEVAGYPANVAWTATSNAAWLSVPAQGSLTNGTGQLTASLSQAQLDTLADGSYAATITLTPQAGDPVSIPVTLKLNPAEVSYVAPYVAVAGTSHEVVIRGEHFPANATVSFGGALATNVTRVSDSEIHATYPSSLALGGHDVQVGGSDRSQARLVVVDAPAYAAKPLSFAAGFTPKRILYDAERRALLVVLADHLASANNAVVRFAYDLGSGSWHAAEHHTIPNLTDLALSTDGQELLATSFSPMGMRHYDPLDFALRATVLDPVWTHDAVSNPVLAVANDGIAVIAARSESTAGPLSNCGALMRYRIRMATYFPFDVSPGGGCDQFIAASADGSLIVAGANLNGEIDRYDAATRTVSSPPVFGAELNSAPVLDRHATRIVLNGTRVYDAAFQMLGELPSTTKAVLLSPDGAAAWTYDASGKVRKFDLVASPMLGLFPEIGTGTTLAASPDVDGDGGIVMTSTPEADVLFIAGDDGVVVQPAP